MFFSLLQSDKFCHDLIACTSQQRREKSDNEHHQISLNQHVKMLLIILSLRGEING